MLTIPGLLASDLSTWERGAGVSAAGPCAHEWFLSLQVVEVVEATLECTGPARKSSSDDALNSLNQKIPTEVVHDGRGVRDRKTKVSAVNVWHPFEGSSLLLYSERTVSVEKSVRLSFNLAFPFLNALFLRI